MSTTPGRISANTGWLWLKQGMNLFRQQPAALTTVLFANVLLVLLLQIIPWIGQLIAMLLIPSLSMALMQACLLIESKQRVTLAVLATGFRKPLVFILLKIGMAYLAVMVLTNLPVWLAARDVVLPAPGSAAPDTGQLLIVLTCGIVQIFAIVTLSFAAPLASWQQMDPLKALFYSFFSVWRSARVFVVMLLSWLGMCILLSSIPRMLLGNTNLSFVVMAWISFVMILLLQCAMFASYRQLFGAPEQAKV